MRVLAVALLCLVPFGANAKQSPYPPVTQFNGDKYAAHAQMGADVANAARAKKGAKSRRAAPTRRYAPPRTRQRWHGPVPFPAPRPLAEPGSVEPQSMAGGIWQEARHVAARVIGGRPAGCPSRFCGCGASLHLFGRIIPALNLAANWLRFPRAAPAPKMVAARRGHVFVLERHIAGNTWLVFDANSGGRRTRIHPRSIAGYSIVNPHGA